jgi:hypothetical protein
MSTLRVSTERFERGAFCAAILASFVGSFSIDSRASAAENYPTRALALSSTITCIVGFPDEVRRYAIDCPAARYLDVRITDCCLPGDHWQAAVKAFDSKPNTAITTATGSVTETSVPARVYNYGGTSENPGLKALVSCSYLHGLSSFPAAAFLQVRSNAGACTTTELGPTHDFEAAP